MCRALNVSRGGYYGWAKRPASARSQRRVVLQAAIRTAHQDSRRTYGSPRVQAVLRRDGAACCVNTVARIMREDGLKAKVRRRFRLTTDSSHASPVAANVLGRDFAAAASNRKWVADLTYIRTAEGWLYLAVELDLYSRRIVGWALSERMTAALVIDALAMAIQQRQPPAGVMHHSDRGSQYASRAFRRMLEAHNMVCSMSRRAEVYDNAVMESFFGTLKRELAGRTGGLSRDQARTVIFEWIEVFYNRRRLHSSLGYLSPADFESAA